MKKTIYLLIAILSVSIISGCGGTGKKPHPNVIISTEEPAPDYCGSWTSTVKADDGKEYKLDLMLNTNSTARYEVTDINGEKIADCQGDWAKTDEKIVMDLYDTVNDIVWRADYKFTYEGDTFALTVTRGKELVKGVESITFSRP